MIKNTDMAIIQMIINLKKEIKFLKGLASLQNKILLTLYIQAFIL